MDCTRKLFKERQKNISKKITEAEDIFEIIKNRQEYETFAENTLFEDTKLKNFEKVLKSDVHYYKKLCKETNSHCNEIKLRSKEELDETDGFNIKAIIKKIKELVNAYENNKILTYILKEICSLKEEDATCCVPIISNLYNLLSIF